jgi:hypothetical protein
MAEWGDVSEQLKKVLEEAYSELDDTQQKVFAGVLEIENEKKNQTNPRVKDDLANLLERVVSS